MSEWHRAASEALKHDRAVSKSKKRRKSREAEIKELKAAVERVRQLHRTGPGDPTPGGSICWCCGSTWPCPTIKALDGEK